MTGWFKSWFVFSSFGPLYFIVGLKLCLTKDASWWIALAFIALSFVAFFVARWIISRLRTGEPLPFLVSEVRSVDSEIFPYLMTYVPIFLENDLSDGSFAYPVAALYVLIFILYLRLDSPYLNPFFALFGVRVYEAKTKDDDRIVIIAKGRRLANKEELSLQEVGTGDVYYYSCGDDNK
jgi:hypothetical protein